MIDLFEMKYRIKKGEWRAKQEIPVYTLYTMEEFRAFVDDPSMDISSLQTSALYERINGPKNYIDEDHTYGALSWEVFCEEGNIISSGYYSIYGDIIPHKWYGINYFDWNLAEVLFSEYELKECIKTKTGISPDLVEDVFIVEVKSWVPAVAVVIADDNYYFIELSENKNFIVDEHKTTYFYDYELYTYEEYYNKYANSDYAYVVAPDGTTIQTQHIANVGKNVSVVPLSTIFEALGGDVFYNEEKSVIYYSYNDNNYLVALTENSDVVEQPMCLYKQNADGNYSLVTMYSWAGSGSGQTQYVDGTEYLLNCVFVNSHILKNLGYRGEFVGNDYYLSEFK